MKLYKKVLDDPYKFGENDLEQICRLAKSSVFLLDLNPPEFWQRPRVWEIIDSCAARLGAKNIIFYIPASDSEQVFPADHPIFEMERRGMLRTVEAKEWYEKAFPYCGFRIANVFDATLMLYNGKMPQYPYIHQLRSNRRAVAVLLSTLGKKDVPGFEGCANLSDNADEFFEYLIRNAVNVGASI